MTSSQQNLLWNYAQRYLAAGFSLIPCKRDKKPDLSHWQEYTVTRPTLKEIMNWFKPSEGWDNESQSIGLVLGTISHHVVVVDLDGIAAVRKFAAQFPQLCEQTKSVLTGSQKGIHLYFRTQEIPDNINVRVQSIGGFELRGNGQYVIAPPSPHESGYHYTIHRNNPILKLNDLNNVRDWMQSLREDEQAKRQAEISSAARPVPVTTSKSKEAYLKKVVSQEIARVTTSGQGNRNNSLFYAAMRLANFAAGGELDWSEMASMLTLATDLPIAEAKRTVASAYKIGSKFPKRVTS
jgi:Bifunctional DNA primase/polymerase, N-terminal